MPASACHFAGLFSGFELSSIGGDSADAFDLCEAFLAENPDGPFAPGRAEAV